MDKEYILSEIKRTTNENGGVPLGSQRFSHITGIKKSDWWVKHWVRWGDALKEAGFVPNEFQQAYNDEYLLEKLCSWIRELGHFPIIGEIRMKSRSDPKFPSHTVFSRWGGKDKLLTKIITYCEQKGWIDIIAICREVPTNYMKENKEGKSDEVFGSVYLGKSGKYYKIGRTNSTGRRERELSIQLPKKLNIVHTIKTDDPAGIEAYWHNRFVDKRLNGEWFELTSTDISSFKRRKFM